MKSVKFALQLLLLPLFILALSWTTRAQNSDSKGSHVSFCTVLTQPEKFLNKRVTFTANVQAGLWQPPLLVAASGCPEQSLLFKFSDKGTRFAELKGVIMMVTSKLDGQPSIGSLLFVGVVRKDKVNQAPAVQGLLPFYSITLESAHEIGIKD